MVLNEEQWIKELREKRVAYGISQGRLAVASGITREYLNKIESGKMKPSKELLETLHKELARFNPEAPLTMLFDYVKIRFPTLDIQHIIKDILKLNINYMLHEDYGHYSYTEHYSLGDIFIYTSADEEKGVLLELKGRGCRQFESYLLAQQRSWYKHFSNHSGKGVRLMKPSDFQKTVQCRFESCLKKVVRHIVKDYQQGLKRRKDKEIPFCELPEIFVENFAVWDDYETDYTIFSVCGIDIRVLDDELAEALKKLPERKRNTLLMYYFLEMTESEIANLQKITQSGVFRNRHHALETMKKILKEKQ